MPRALEKMLRAPKSPGGSDAPERRMKSFERDERRPAAAASAADDDPEGFRTRLYAALKEREGGVPAPKQPRIPSPEQQGMYKELRALEDYRRASRVTYGPGGVAGSQGTPMTQRVAEQQAAQAKDILSNYEAKRRATGASATDPNSAAARELPQDPHDVAQTPYPTPMTYTEQQANERGMEAAHAAMLARLQRLTDESTKPDMSRHAVGPFQSASTQAGASPSPEAMVSAAESPEDVAQMRAPESAVFKQPKRRDYKD